MMVIEGLYVVISSILVVAGLTMVGLAIRSYARTQRTEMIALSIGFGFIMTAAVATTISAFLNQFNNVKTVLTVDHLLTTIGFLLLMYSLTID